MGFGFGYDGSMITNPANNVWNKLLDEAFSPIQIYLNDPTVREVMINGEDQVWVERKGSLHSMNVVFSRQRTRNLVRLLSSVSDGIDGKQGTKECLLDTQYRNYRISAVSPPVCREGPVLCIRKQGGTAHPLQQFVPPQKLPYAVSENIENSWPVSAAIPGKNLVGILEQWVNQGFNVLVSGGTGTGKTAFLNSLLTLIPDSCRLVVIEDTPELKPTNKNTVFFQTSALHGIGIRELVRQALRFRPDRIMVGEVRGAESFDLLQAMNTGHQGCFGTLHANGSLETLGRLEQMVMQASINWGLEAIRNQIAASVQGVVHLGRLQGRRFVKELITISGVTGGVYDVQKIWSS